MPPLKLAGVVRLFEMLQMKCGVSVSKMVAVEERAKGGGGRARKKSGPSKTTKWVQEAEFQGRNSTENMSMLASKRMRANVIFSTHDCNETSGECPNRPARRRGRVNKCLVISYQYDYIISI